MEYSRYWNPDVAAVPKSGIRKFFDIVQTMPGAISLGVGEPDFVTPYHIRNAAIDSLLELARLGYYRGFVKRLETLQASHPAITPWARALQTQARAFRFEAIVQQLQDLRPSEDNDATHAP